VTVWAKRHFCVTKTSTAEQLAILLANDRLFDPEQVKSRPSSLAA